MSPPPQFPISASCGILGFACGHCAARLEVPVHLAGVQGPCPMCGCEITAPQWMPEAAAQAPAVWHAAELLTRPPRIREIPPPVVNPNQNVRAAESDRLQEHRRSERPWRAPSGMASPMNERISPEPGRGIFNELSGDRGKAGATGPAKQAFRRRGWQRWLDAGIVAVFAGVLLACLAALRFTIPAETKAVPNLPPNLTQLVERESRNLELRRQEAVALAGASVDRYLGAASEQAASSHLLPPPDGVAQPPFPPFTESITGPYVARSSRRIAGTDRFLVVMQPKQSAGPVFVVEQTDSGPRLHAGAITQQSAGLFEKFLATPGDGEATLYTEVAPLPADRERTYRSQRPDLAKFQFVDVHSPFPGAEAKAFIACLMPDSEAARTFARRSHDPDRRPAVIHVRWLRHRESGPYAEIVQFIPGPWSGERPLTPPASLAPLASRP